MKTNYFILFAFLLAANSRAQNTSSALKDTLPQPYATQSVNKFSDVIGWGNGVTPVAPAGFKVSKFADGFDNPRWICITPNGDILVAESNSATNIVKKVGGTILGASKADNLSGSANRITLLRQNSSGKIILRTTFLSNLNQPFGMLVMGNYFYVANTDGIIRYPYKAGQTSITVPGKRIMNLPAGKYNRHWTRNIIANPERNKIMVAVGSGSNVAEDGLKNEVLRADILEIDPDGSHMHIYAAGLRNPVGMDWAPGTHTLWAAVNERDYLGDELVPDYLTSVKEHGFYGWPYVYYGQHPDPRVKDKRPDFVRNTIVPDIDLGSHTASLGLAFYTKNSFPAKYHNGAFVAQHGSYNRSQLSGYKLLFVPFKNGRPSGKPEDFLTGFIADRKSRKVHGRPVGVFVAPGGALLVTDDISNTIWKISVQ
ncbi:MAG TPA: L-sorbosone dehydrogenase [Mucilaginibacter sp.]|jgi:glucose/arabinose dehydrogenase|nr:L-sorbosone dehydrogenase [Mucilaginibacter sp.]